MGMPRARALTREERSQLAIQTAQRFDDELNAAMGERDERDRLQAAQHNAAAIQSLMGEFALANEPE